MVVGFGSVEAGKDTLIELSLLEYTSAVIEASQYPFITGAVVRISRDRMSSLILMEKFGGRHWKLLKKVAVELSCDRLWWSPCSNLIVWKPSRTTYFDISLGKHYDCNDWNCCFPYCW